MSKSPTTSPTTLVRRLTIAVTLVIGIGSAGSAVATAAPATHATHGTVGHVTVVRGVHPLDWAW